MKGGGERSFARDRIGSGQRAAPKSLKMHVAVCFYTRVSLSLSPIVRVVSSVLLLSFFPSVSIGADRWVENPTAYLPPVRDC